MPTIIDSLFLELGIDVTRFSADQQNTLKKIQEFESQATRSGKKAGGAIKTVSQAFHDLANDTAVGGGAKRIATLATKLKSLGQAAQVSGGAGTPFGAMVKGLGMLLSPASLGIAAVGLLGKSVWDLNEAMTASNATLSRNAELAGMSADKLWAMGQAARTVGGNPAAVEAGIAGLKTLFAGAAEGVGNATMQTIGIARLRQYGARFSPGGYGAGPDIESLFKAVHAMYRDKGRAATLALLTGYGLASPDEANLFMSKNGYAEYRTAQAKADSLKAPGGFNAIVTQSLKSQAGLGEKDIAKAITAETAYGGIQEPMQTMVGLLTGIYALLGATLGKIASGVSSIWSFFTASGKSENWLARKATTIEVPFVAAAKAVSRAVNWAFPDQPSPFSKSPPTKASTPVETPAPVVNVPAATVAAPAVNIPAATPTSAPVVNVPAATVAAPPQNIGGLLSGVGSLFKLAALTISESLAALGKKISDSLFALSKRGAISIGETQSAQGIAGEQDVELGTFISQGIRRLFSSPPAAASRELKAREALAMKTLIERGVPAGDAGAIVGNFVQESTLDPLATSDNGAHLGLAQWDRKRQRSFAKQFGYPMGSPTVPVTKQFLDQLAFAQNELATTQRAAWRQMVSALTLFGKTQAFEAGYEKPGDLSLGRRFFDAERALALVSGFSSMLAAANANPTTVHHSIKNDTKIRDIIVQTQATDAKGVAAGIRKAVTEHPLINPNSQLQVALAVRATSG